MLLAGFALVSCMKPFWGRSGEDPGTFPVPCDFTFRMNEIQCLRKGVDPFDVWHADVKMPPYYPNNRPDLRDEECTEPINAYAPWEYTLMMPLSFLPLKTAWVAYLAFMFACLGAIAAAGYRMGKEIRGNVWEGVFAAAIPVVLSFYPVWSNFCIGNLMVPVIAALAAMVWCLDRGHDISAGVCWAIAMVKPQAAILFAVPLLWRRKFLTCAVAAGLCILLSVPPALLCKASVVKLIMETPAANTFAFNGCGTFPYCFCSGAGDVLGINIGLAVGLLACLAMTWMIRKKKDWLVFAMPAFVCSMCWSYVQVYSYAAGWAFFLTLAIAFLRGVRSRFFWIAAAISTPFFMRLYLMAYKIATVSGFCEPDSCYAACIHPTLDNFCSTLCLLTAMPICHILGKSSEWR